MLQNEAIDSPEQALDMIQGAHLMGELEGVINLLSDYAGEAILAETNEEKAIVQANCLHITKALGLLQAPYKAQLRRIWLSMSLEATQAAAATDILVSLAKRLKGLEPDFDAILEGMMARFEASNPLDYERIPMAHFCESFQKWALEAEGILNKATGREATVTVYNLAAAADNAVCLIVVNVEAEDAAGAELKMTLPLSCLSNERHFQEKHFEDVQRFFNELLETL